MAKDYGRIGNYKDFDMVKLAALILICGYMMFTIFPVFWMLSTALKIRADVYKVPPDLIPLKPTLESFKKLFTVDRIMWRFFLNSIIISGGVAAVCFGAGILAGYSLSRLQRFGRSRLIMMFVLVAQMFPMVLLSIPLYVYFARFHLLDTHIIVILAHSAVALPFCIWLFKGFFDAIPIELEEAAKIDGCGRGKILTRIVIPLVRPGIVTSMVYAVLLSWREFLLGLIFTSTEASRPITPAIAVYYFGFASLRWDDVMAVSILTLTPLLLIYIFLQKYVISGLVAGAVKG